nr:LysR substrate-binding domain-containing protein [Paenibacillus thiaminolyticus]
MLAQYKAQFSNINISMKITSSQQLTPLLVPNGVEFLILSDHIPIDEPLFYANTFRQDNFVFIAPPHHPLAQQDMCTLHDLQHETFLMTRFIRRRGIFSITSFRRGGLPSPIQPKSAV